MAAKPRPPAESMRPEALLAAAEPFTTPVAAVDVATMDANLFAMQQRVAALGWRLRPHAKTHKSSFVARRQIAQGAHGLTAATLREAELFADAGVDDILLAHPPVGAAKLRRVADLAARLRRLAVSVDSVEAVAGVPANVEILWEVDSGHHRLGSVAGRTTVPAVRRLVEAVGIERFRGLLTFPGHVYAARDPAGVASAAEHERAALRATVDLLRAEGIPVRELSLGSTPTIGLRDPAAGAAPEVGDGSAAAARTATASDAGIVIEARPGSYVYGDVQQVALGAMSQDDCALGVVATVVATPAVDRAVIDAGSKALAADVSVPTVQGYGRVAGRENLLVQRMSEEHGVLIAQGSSGLTVGDRVVVIPVHCCTTVNLHPAVLMVEGGAGWWDPVAARGWQAAASAGGA